MKKYLPFVIIAVALAGVYIILNKPADEIKNNNQALIKQNINTDNTKGTQSKFSGEVGEKIELENGKVILTEESFEGTIVNFYNIQLSNGKVVYFFVVRDKQGIFRAAAR